MCQINSDTGKDRYGRHHAALGLMITPSPTGLESHRCHQMLQIENDAVAKLGRNLDKLYLLLLRQNTTAITLALYPREYSRVLFLTISTSLSLSLDSRPSHLSLTSSPGGEARGGGDNRRKG